MSEAFMKPMGPEDCNPLVRVHLIALDRFGDNLAGILQWRTGQAAIHRIHDATIRTLIRQGIITECSFMGEVVHKITPKGRQLVQQIRNAQLRHKSHTPWYRNGQGNQA